MKKVLRITVRVLAIWLALSAIASAAATYAPTLDARYNVITNRYGLLIIVPHTLADVDDGYALDYLGDVFAAEPVDHALTVYNPLSLACDGVLTVIK